MPTRMVDGDALWRSDKLSQVKPASFRAEYANLIPLALADGTFECNSRRVWADVYSYNRPDIAIEDVDKILDEFERVGLLIRIEKDGKVWGYWAGIESRLPSESTRDRYKNGVGDTIKSAVTRERCVYFLQDSESEAIKIGFCYFDRLRARIKEIQTGTPGKLLILGVIRSVKRGLENDLHIKWSKYQTNSESEWFKNHHDILQYIEENSEDVDFTDVTFVKNQGNTEAKPNTISRGGHDRIGLDLDRNKIGLDRSEESAKSDFQNLRLKYKQHFKKSCSTSSKNESWYIKVCKEYGEKLVLNAFDIWADENSWRDKKPDLYFFFTDISRYAYAVKTDEKDEEKLNKQNEEDKKAMEFSDRYIEEKRLEAQRDSERIAAEEAEIAQMRSQPFAC